MESITINRLKQAEWTDKRRVNIEPIEKIFKEKKIYMPKTIQAFLQQYGMLEIKFKREMQSSYIDEVIELNPIKAIGNNLDSEYFGNILVEYDINETVYPIGMANRGNLLMLMTESGIFYRYTDGFLCKDGDNIEEMLDCVVGECTEPFYFE